MSRQSKLIHLLALITIKMNKDDLNGQPAEGIQGVRGVKCPPVGCIHHVRLPKLPLEAEIQHQIRAISKQLNEQSF